MRLINQHAEGRLHSGPELLEGVGWRRQERTLCTMYKGQAEHLVFVIRASGQLRESAEACVYSWVCVPAPGTGPGRRRECFVCLSPRIAVPLLKAFL